MAYYAALTTLVNLVEDILLRNQYPDFLLGKHPVMKSLHKNLTLLEESLEGYSSKGDEANDLVEGRIRDAAHQAQDIIEFQILYHVSSQAKISEMKLSFFKKSFEEFRMVNETIVSCLEEMKIIKETHANEDWKPEWDSFDTSMVKMAPVDRNITVGLDEYLITIKDQLCGHASHLHVIPIVGAGGIGKTTLARSAYEDSLVVYRFDRRAWVVASQDFNVNQFLRTVATSLGIMTDELLGKDEGVLMERIYKHLKGRRYLVVIDDIWSTKVWDDVKQIFPNDSNGSRIMLTTRLLDVAENASTSGFLHNMQFLNDDQSWNLLQQKVFGYEPCPSELEGTGKLIARHCCGLPLAIVVIAGVLSTKMILDEWKKVAWRVREILSDTNEQLSKIFSLSYIHLSHQLKSCFLYMGSFPEDHEINISHLIKLWVAEGFLKSMDRTKIFEDVAAECLTDLVKRNLVIVTKKRCNGQPKFCVLHDLLREFCRERALHENFFHTSLDDCHLYPKANKNVRHVNWYYKGHYHSSRHPYQNWPVLRSLHLFGENGRRDFIYPEWANFKLLRVFDEYSRISTSVEHSRHALFELFNLKYAGFCPIPGPFRFSRRFMLQNLQSLIIQSSLKVELPCEIWKMKHLRHLIFGMMKLPSVPKVNHKLECLQTLMTVKKFTITDEALKVIPNLRKMKMSCTVKYHKCWWEWHGLNNLFNLPRLEELKIRVNSYSTTHLPTKFAFPLNLRKLSLLYCQIPWKDMTVVGSLPHLQVLKLEDESFVGEEWEPKENEFLCLKYLLLEGLDLKYWRAEETHFPCLEHLVIKQCDYLEMIPLDIGDIPTLKVIEVFENGHVIGDSAICIREEQMNQGNDGLRLYINKYES